MQTIVGDVRHALRQFRKAPVWTLSVAGTLALGIGAATAMFSIGNAVLFRPLPYPEPERLVVLWSRNPPKAIEQDRVTLADFADWRARSHVFQEIGYSFLWPGSRSTIVRTSTSVAVHSALVSSSWLRALGVAPMRGRFFTSGEDRRGANLVALISDDFWQQQFGRDPSILGRTLKVDSYDVKNYQIVGVMSCVVEQRTAEIGVRMALGARATDVFGMVLGRGLVLAVAGLALGSAGALVLRNLIAGLLFETSASDPVALGTAAALLLATALAACCAPSRRAARVDPLIALRHDG